MLNISSHREFLWDVNTELIDRYKYNDQGGFQRNVPLPDAFASSNEKVNFMGLGGAAIAKYNSASRIPLGREHRVH